MEVMSILCFWQMGQVWICNQGMEIQNNKMKFNTILLDDFSYNYVRYPKKMTWEEFKRFGFLKGQVICERYNILLTGYETRNEKILRNLKKINMKNFDRGMTKFNKGVAVFQEIVKK